MEPYNDPDDIPRARRELSDAEVDALIDERQLREIEQGFFLESGDRMCEALDRINEALIAARP